MQRERILGRNGERLHDELLAQAKVVRENVLDANVEQWQVTARHKVGRLEEGRDGLVVLGLLREGVPVEEPRRREEAVESGRFEQKAARQIDLFNEVVVAAQDVPRDLPFRVEVD